MFAINGKCKANNQFSKARAQSPSAPISVAQGNFVALRITTFGGYFRRRIKKDYLINEKRGPTPFSNS
jgi:hypothetical protein